MAKTFKCPHCGALYEITYEKTVSHDKHAADCQVCGKQRFERLRRRLAGLLSAFRTSLTSIRRCKHLNGWCPSETRRS